MFLFTTLHETTHHTAFASAALNRVVARGCSLVLVLPALWFKHFHMAHHRHTHDAENDPELASPKPVTGAQYWLHISGLPTWQSAIKTLLINASGRCEDSFIAAANQRSVQMEALVMLAFYALIAGLSLAFGSSAAFWAWVIPALIGQPFLRLYLLAEHGRCAPVANMFENTRTTFTHRLVRQLAWNMPYHAEHHAYPAVPFYRLPELHKLTQSHLKKTSPSYRDFHHQYRREELR